MKQVLITTFDYEGDILEGSLSIPDDMDLNAQLKEYEALQREGWAILDKERFNGLYLERASDERRNELGLNKSFSDWLRERGARDSGIEIFDY